MVEKLPCLDETSDVVLVVDRERRIVAHNDRVELALGHAAGDLLGRTIDSLIVSSRTIALPRDHVAFARDVEIFDRNGILRPAELVLCPDVQNVITIVRLPSEIAMTEQEVAEIVHDLKTPLSTIALDTTLMIGHAVRAEQLERIERNVWYMDRLINQLLDRCSLHHGSLALQRRPIELRGLLEGAIVRVVPAIRRHRIRLDAPRRMVVACDEMRIERVVANFIENALKYADAETAIVVRLTDSGTHACVSVIDCGPGIPQGELASLFDAHQRGSTAAGQRGSGLGLHLSRKIIEAHEGRVGVESVVGVGSRFFFELPVMERATADLSKIRRLRDTNTVASRA